MMYVSCRNLRSLARRVRCGVLTLGLLLAFPAAGWAASALSAPQTGLESGQRHSFGPDSEAQRDPRYMMSAPMDAYGNPVTPMEQKETVRVRPRAGAYGVQPSAPTRPLPKAPERDAGWKFR